MLLGIIALAISLIGTIILLMEVVDVIVNFKWIWKSMGFAICLPFIGLVFMGWSIFLSLRLLGVSL